MEYRIKMKYFWLIIFIIASCGISNSKYHDQSNNNSHDTSLGKYVQDFQHQFVGHYTVSSPVFDELLQTSLDSCQSIVGCGIVEYVFLGIDLETIEIESLRRPLSKLAAVSFVSNSEVASFYIDETLCFIDKQQLNNSNYFTNIQKLDKLELSEEPFKYECLDIESEGEVYNTLVTFRFLNQGGNFILDYHSVFIDCGDVDLSKELENRGLFGG